MRLLLDTHILIWAVAEPSRLADAARGVVEDTANQVLFSSASIWEIAIKASLGHVDFYVVPRLLLEAAVSTGFTEPPVNARAALKVAELPPHHRDSFDRILVAQAMAEPAQRYTVDRKLAAYSELVVQVS
ncbi:MAG: type II toxin-antitoxin system VapC family toxin [Proteobacteria bacterium]|nr:type II toxin-antitoxin system VapC family toxin [Pseudomonadota bacterium]